MTTKLRFATVWLAGCSGCHMSFLDLDEWLFELAERVEIVYSPVASDSKVFPEGVDLCLVEGAVANADNLDLALQLRARSKVVVSFGDCAVTANVPGLRNLWAGVEGGSRQSVLDRGYLELADTGGAAAPRTPLAAVAQPGRQQARRGAVRGAERHIAQFKLGNEAKRQTDSANAGTVPGGGFNLGLDAWREAAGFQSGAQSENAANQQ